MEHIWIKTTTCDSKARVKVDDDSLDGSIEAERDPIGGDQADNPSAKVSSTPILDGWFLSRTPSTRAELTLLTLIRTLLLSSSIADTSNALSLWPLSYLL